MFGMKKAVAPVSNGTYVPAAEVNSLRDRIESLRADLAKQQTDQKSELSHRSGEVSSLGEQLSTQADRLRDLAEAQQDALSRLDEVLARPQAQNDFSELADLLRELNGRQERLIEVIQNQTQSDDDRDRTERVIDTAEMAGQRMNDLVSAIHAAQMRQASLTTTALLVAVVALLAVVVLGISFTAGR